MKKKIIIFLLVCFFIPYHVISANSEVIVGGDSIGIEGKYDGVYVSGTYHFKIQEEVIEPEHYIKPKDIIIKVNGERVNGIDSFTTQVNKYTHIKNVIPITLLRNQKMIDSTLITNVNADGSQFGLYLKDRILGIGTLTFYDPQTRKYGALGHSISEDENEQLQNGTIYNATISSVKKAKDNAPGEKNGSIQFNEQLGDIDENTQIGIYGDYYEESDRVPVAIGDPSEVTLGDASFYTTIQGSDKRNFSIEIIDIEANRNSVQKALTFKVDDATILEKCGGIIHGMSGSPIIQNNKIIGAITHVKVDDPTIGYGIYITNMVKEANN